MVRMYHDDPVQTGGPTTADVPEEAVPWMRDCGWYVKTPAPEPAPTPATPANDEAAEPADNAIPAAQTPDPPAASEPSPAHGGKDATPSKSRGKTAKG